MTEYDIIRTIAAKFPRSKNQLNNPFECDAELIRIGNEVWGLTMDDFSPEEDMFTSDHPEILGANLAVATLGDLLAAGVEPRFFMHALSIPRNIPPSFLEGMIDGIRTILQKANCTLCGGDLGMSETWRYCGFAMGSVSSVSPLTHKLSGTPQTLWVTGQLGDANLAALRKTSTPVFELRLKEAEAIRRYATGCIDTSGGLLDAIWILHECNPGMRIEIHAEKIPLATGIHEFATIAGIPAEASLAGGAGEYELLFATSESLARFIPFQENYNLESVAKIKSATSLPVIAVGGIRTRSAMIDCLEKHRLDGVSVCRPLICEPDWPMKLRNGVSEHSECTNCNFCAIYCDSLQSLRCYRQRKKVI